MPHRLRRIIGVNIRTPRADGSGTSMRFSQLDTRGAVMAVGPNGVGKTSFLRLIPVFYGALPSRILRGSGHTRMVRYMLPLPSSAVVFEYERESERDVRCAVMHASSDEAIDAPIFHIIGAPFEERFLCDEQGHFLTREEFKAHVEGMGIEVSQQLSHAEYRAVILNSVGLTKNALKLKRIAAQHSLAPGSLSGMDEIAAAMGPEAMSFQAMQQIVVDQVTSEMTSEQRTDRRLLKRAEDVAGWLDGHEHLTKLQARADDAQILAQRAREIAGLDELLRELRGAATKLVESEQEAKQNARRDRARVEEEGQARQEELCRAYEDAKAAVSAARDRVETLQERRDRIEAKELRFRQMDAERLDAEEAHEQGLKAARARLEDEQGQLRAQAEGIAQSFQERSQAVKNRLAADEARIGVQETQLANGLVRQLDAIRKEQTAALEGLVPPARLQDISAEVSALNQRAGELQALARNPSASSEILGQIEELDGRLQEAREAAAAAHTGVADARDAHRIAERQRDALLLDHERLQTELQQLHAAAADLERQLTPAPGSLLTHVRGLQDGGRATLAKALNPELLNRTDLHPRPAELDTQGPLEPGEITIGPLVLQVQEVAEPDWLELASVRGRLQALRDRLSGLGEDAKGKESAVSVANRQVEEASGLVTRKGAQADMRNKDVERLQSQLRQAKTQRDHEVATARTHSEAERRKVVAQLEALRQEEQRLQQEQVGARERISKEFSARAAEANQQHKVAVERLGADREEARRHAEGQLEALKKQEGRELSAAGVDTDRLNAVRAELATINHRLEAIARSREDVKAWREFRDGDMRNLPHVKEELQHAAGALETTREAARGADMAREEHAQRVRDELDRLDRLDRAAAENLERLQALLTQQLGNVGEPRLGGVVQTWTVDDLVQEVSKRRRDLFNAASSANDLIAAIRGQMRAGRYQGIHDWLERHEQDLSPLVEGQPEHLATLKRARMLCQWYEGAAHDVIHSHNAELSTNLAAAGDFVNYLDVFDRLVAKVNTQLQAELAKVKPFPTFRDLAVKIRSKVNDLDYMSALRQMKDRADSSVALHRITTARARNTQLADKETVALMRTFRDLLARERGIAANLSELVRLECELTINGQRMTIENADSFKTHASNGNTGMIFAMFLMGFAGMVRRSARAPVRLTWIVDELGRFDTSNLQTFLDTLDENNIDVISARPEADPTTLDLFDSESRFGLNGRISTTRLSADTWEAIDVAA